MYDDVYLVDDGLILATDADVTALEQRLGMPLPIGYREFVTRLGYGDYCGDVRVFTPDLVEAETAKLHTLLRTHDFWNGGIGVLNQAQLLESVLIARTHQGDEIIVHPRAEHGVYVLPRHDDVIYWMTPVFDDPLAWRTKVTPVIPPPPFRYFAPGRDRAQLKLIVANTIHPRHLLDRVASMIQQALQGDQEVRTFERKHQQWLFIKAVGGRVLFTMGDQGQVSIRMNYPVRHEDLISGCVQQLLQLGLHQTQKYRIPDRG